MEMDGPVGGLVRVAAGIGVSVLVAIGTFVLVGMIAVDVKVATPITTGVGVNIDGVGVDGRNGVGPGRGCMTQPLQDVNIYAKRTGKISFFIFSPRVIVSLLQDEAKPPKGLLWN
jgi:hypothetical protein